jgi:hypothetical protein
MRSGEATPALGSNPSSAESIDAGGAAAVPDSLVPSTPIQARRPSMVNIERSYPRVAAFVAMRKARRRSCRQRGRTFPPHAGPHITWLALGQECELKIIGTIIPAGAGIRFHGDGASLVTGPWRTARELETKAGRWRRPDRRPHRLIGLPKPFQSARCRMCPKIRPYAMVQNNVPEHISPKKNISAKQNISAA